MDFALWDPSDDQVEDENKYYIDDYCHSDFYFGYGPDAIEEDELNEKSCVQVLRILVNKADEEIMELEEDVVILKSKLTWGDKDWSDQCSATLQEKIDHLDISMLTLKKEISEDEHIFGIELLKNKKLAKRLHDILKPLWDNCFLLEKSQTRISIIRRSIQPADELRTLMCCSKHRKLKAKKVFARMKNNEYKGPSEDPEVRRIKHPKAPADTILDSQLDAKKQVTENSSSVQKARRQEVSAMKKIGYRTQLQRERKRTNVCGVTKISETQATETELTISGILLELSNRKRKCASKPQMKVKQKPQANEVLKIEVDMKQAKFNSLLEPEVQSLESNCQELVIFQEPCLAEEIDSKSSSTDKFKSQQKIEISENIASNHGVRSQVSTSSVSRLEKKKKLSLSSQVENKELRIVPFKLENLHDNESDRTMVGQDVRSLSHPASSIKNVKDLTVKDLRVIAKSQKLPLYYKLRKDELREGLGL